MRSQPGDAWLRVAPIDKGWRQERVRVALPKARKLVSETSLGNHVSECGRVVSEGVVSEARPPTRDMPATQGVLPAVPPDCPAELVERMGADMLAKVERRWPRKHHDLGPCLVWRDGEPTIQGAGGLYGRIYDPALKRSDAAHRVVWRRVYGPIPRGLEVDELCEITLCVRPDHLQLLTKSANVKRRGPTRGPHKAR
jgi:hypothetical protein